MNSSAPYTPYNPRLKRASTPQQSNSRSATPVSSPAGARRVGTPEPAVAAFPFQAVPSGSSPFPPSTPSGSTTPIRNGTPVAGGSSNGFLVRAQSPSLANGGQSAGKEAERTPYRSGFQPQGVRRDRTEEFAGKRKSRSDGKKLEEGRLGRRMEKLVALHFPPPAEPTSDPTPPVRLSRLSSISELSGSLRGKTAKDLWRTVAGNKSELERAEQGIVKWQEDSEATRCPICLASFGLKTRRHHCRLCGRVVCFLPPSPPAEILAQSSSPASTTFRPTRRERCSTFITCEYEGVLVGGEKKPVGVIVEIEQVEPDSSFGAIANEVHQPKEKDERKKVRLCRDCLNVVLRQQEETLPSVTPIWLKLYELLVQLEHEIETSLPDFQELVLSVQKPSSAIGRPASAATAQNLRKRLLTNLASYDAIAKRIRDLPFSDHTLPGGSQDRLQRAMAQRGALFLGEKLALLRSLGDIDDSKEKKRKSKSLDQPTVKSLASLLGKDEEKQAGETTSKLAVLLEQESLVQGYVEDANHRRQFEDAASLKASLDELRAEISRLRLAG